MGAQFCSLSVPASQSRDAVRAAFRDAQDTDRYENGHSYSGGFGMADGLKFIERPPFPSHDDALTFLHKTCEKWRAALAVRHATPDGTEMWLIGAWCAS